MADNADQVTKPAAAAANQAKVAAGDAAQAAPPAATAQTTDPEPTFTRQGWIERAFDVGASSYAIAGALFQLEPDQTVTRSQLDELLGQFAEKPGVGG